MDTEHPRFDEFVQRFEALAEDAQKHEGQKPALSGCKIYLTLFGENGLSPEEEFEFLDKLATHKENGLKRLDIETSYWQNIVLFVE
ncbi:MAG: hypothetical protein KTR14_09985 [Vampirovibrio sp.]|nr:hypothetical protein [Vampirovibrio sp.]